MTDEKKQELQENETAGTDGKTPEQRTFTQDEVTEIVKRRLAKLERKHLEEIDRLRETLGVNVERAQHLEHDNKQARKQLEELEELREYKAQRERDDMLKRISGEFGGVPVDLLSGETEEELYACAGKIRAYADKFKPKVPETKAAGMTPAPDSIAAMHSTIKDRRERIEKIAERYRATNG